MAFSSKRAHAERGSSRAGRAGGRAASALDARLPVMEGGRALLRKAFPDHWSFFLGELALYSFVVLVLTGVYLTFFFQPSTGQVVYHGSYTPLDGVMVTEAYASTLDISFDIRGGLLLRQVHHWASVVFLTAIGLHLMRVFFTGAFRRPREANWAIGVTLFLLSTFEGFCGYSLPDDLLSGTGLRIAQGIVLSVPIVGTYLSFFVFGGEYPGHVVIPRLYSVHILLVPGLLIALITVHLFLVFYLKHTQWAKPGRTNRNVVGHPMFPQFTARSSGLFFMVFGVLTLMGGLAQINPIWVYGPYQTDDASIGSQPDWYVGFLEGSLRLMPPWQTHLWGHIIEWNVFIPAVALPGALFAVLYAYPFFERWITGERGERHLCDRPRNQPTRTGLGVAGISFFGLLLLAGGDDIIAYVFDIELEALVWTLRIAVLALPVVAFLATKRLCLALQARDRQRLQEGDESGWVVQTVEGGFWEGHRPLPRDERYVLLARDLPEPLAVSAVTERGAAPPRRLAPLARLARLRARLSTWYHGDRVEFPVGPVRRRQIAEVVAAQPRHLEEGEGEGGGEGH